MPLLDSVFNTIIVRDNPEAKNDSQNQERKKRIIRYKLSQQLLKLLWSETVY